MVVRTGHHQWSASRQKLSRVGLGSPVATETGFPNQEQVRASRPYYLYSSSTVKGKAKERVGAACVEIGGSHVPKH